MRSRDRFDFSAIRVLDGGLATELERHGCNISGPLWSAEVLDTAPEAIAAVHLDYLRAGADCIATASYQVSAHGYRELGRDPREAEQALRRSIAIAEEARERSGRRDVRIAASLGPWGAVLHNGAEYHGRYEIGFAELVAFHGERLAVVAETDADLVAFETIPSLEEAEAIVVAMESVPQLSAWISFSCCDGSRVAHGEALAACAERLAVVPQVAAIGVNCTAPHFIPSLLGELERGGRRRKPVIVYPNSGEVWNGITRSWEGTTDAGQFGTLARGWFAAGAQAVGGCCRTGPEHIAAVTQAARCS